VEYTTPMVGTARWSAPEVMEVEENREEYTKSADVYSFSMLCFESSLGLSHSKTNHSELFLRAFVTD
jgi:serine/threonine protein kinase